MNSVTLKRNLQRKSIKREEKYIKIYLISGKDNSKSGKRNESYAGQAKNSQQNDTYVHPVGEQCPTDSNLVGQFRNINQKAVIEGS